MEQHELLARTVEVLRRLNVPYFVTGSVASGYFGEPRFTNDIDIVARLTAESLGEFCATFSSPEFYVSEMGAQTAVERGGQFNVIQADTGFKLDVIVPTPSGFSASCFARRREVKGKEVEGSFASPEDVIISKLLFYKEGESPKHLRDIGGILKLCPQPVDRVYIEQWARELGVEDIWRSILKRLESQ